MDIRVARHERTLILELPEEFCPRHAAVVLAPLAQLLANPRTGAVTLDMGNTRLINAEGLTVLRILASVAADRHALVTAVVADSHLRRLLRVLDVDEIMEVTDQWPGRMSDALAGDKRA